MSLSDEVVYPTSLGQAKWVDLEALPSRQVLPSEVSSMALGVSLRFLISTYSFFSDASDEPRASLAARHAL